MDKLLTGESNEASLIYENSRFKQSLLYFSLILLQHLRSQSDYR